MQLILYDIRKNKLHLTQKEMAEKLGISVYSYRQKENGKSSFTVEEAAYISNLASMNIEKIFLSDVYQNVDTKKRF